MPAYALAHLRTVDVNAEIVEYLERIDGSLEPFEGRFIVHGKIPEVIEEPFPGVVVIIEFPDLERARAWYESDEYQAILPFRTENSDGSAILVDGVGPDYRAADFAAAAVAQAGSGGS